MLLDTMPTHNEKPHFLKCHFNLILFVKRFACEVICYFLVTYYGNTMFLDSTLMLFDRKWCADHGTVMTAYFSI